MNKNTLNEIGNRNPFEVPDNYFADFANQMDEKIGFKKPKLIQLMKPWLYMAAMFMGIFVLGNVFYQVYLHHQNTKYETEEFYDFYVSSQIDSSILIDYYAMNNGSDSE